MTKSIPEGYGHPHKWEFLGTKLNCPLLGIWVMLITSSWLLLPGPLLYEMVIHDNVLTMGQIHLLVNYRHFIGILDII